MKQVRKNVFETNSSSSHSLVIRSDSLLKEMEEDTYFTHDEMFDSLRCIDENGCYKSYNNDWYFGRCPFRPLDTFELRFQYAYANSYNDNQRDELCKLLYELVPEVKSINKPKWIGTDDCLLYGWLSKHNITMREFLTNKKYIVIQDGDEYLIWDNLIESGLIDLNAFDNKMR